MRAEAADAAEREQRLAASERRAAVLAGARNVADAAAVDLIADVLADESWNASGIRSVSQWCQWQLGLTASRAGQLVRIAERREELTGTFELFRAGELSSDQVGLIARYAPASHEASIGRVARHMTLSQLRRVLASYRFGVDGRTGTGPGEPDPTAPGVLSFTTRESGRFELRAEGDAEAGARVRAALQQFRAKLRHEREGSDDSDPVTGFEAFMELVDTAVDRDPSRSRRDRSKVVVHLDLEDRELIARTELGPVLDDELRRLITCDASVQAVIEHAGTPLALGRTSRTVPDHLRRLIIDRDQGCVVCGRTVNLDAHHLEHWIDGGATNPNNLITLCSGCHQAHHRNEFDITGDPGRPDGITIRHPDGRPWRRCRRRPPPDRPEVTYRRPSGEPIRRLADIWFQPKPRDPPEKPDTDSG